MTKHKTMRGQEVDVDLIKMKQELMQGKKTDAIIKREDHINDRRRRSSSRRINEMLANEQIVRQKLLDKSKSETVALAENIVEKPSKVDDVSTEGLETPKQKRVIKKQA